MNIGIPKALPLFAILVLAISARAGTIFVDAAAPGPAHDGTSWPVAFQTVQQGINAAKAGDEIWVAGGVYTETITLSVETGLYGGFKGTETLRSQRDRSANVTILDGSHAGSVVTVPAGASSATVIDGFTIRNGTGTPGTGTQTGYLFGGGLYCRQSSPAITHNVFRQNSAGSAGYGYGAGIYANARSPLIAYNTVTDNSGQGITCEGGGSAHIVGNIVRNNTDGLYLSGRDNIVANNNVMGNSKTGLFLQWPPPNIASNNIIAGNGWGVLLPSSTNPGFTHNLVYANAYDDYYSQQPDPGTENLQTNPRFMPDDLHLRPDSPCVDSGNDAAVLPAEIDVDGQPRILGKHVDIGADEYDFSYTLPPPPGFVHVRPDGDDANDGSTWEKAKKTIAAAAFDIATVGGEVWAAAGTYQGRVDVAYRVRLYGGFTGNETSRDGRRLPLQQSVITGGKVYVAADAEAAVIDGFTFSNSGGIDSKAYSLTVSGNRFMDGGVSQTGGSLAVTGNSFGGQPVFGMAVFARTCSVTIANNIIRDRTVAANAFGTTSDVDFSGGAVTVFNSSGTITGNTIEGNSNNSGNATSSYGGGAGICAINSTLFIVGNAVTDNNVTLQAYDGAAPEGGGILGGGGTLFIADNLIANNSLGVAGDLGGSGSGAGIYLHDGSAVLTNNTIAGNTVSALSNPQHTRAAGGGVFFATFSSAAGQYTAINNIVALNNSGVDWYGAQPDWENNDVFANGQDYPANGPNLTGTNGNIAADPLFVSVERADFHLNSTSACIDAGDDLAVGFSTDLDGRFRIQGAHVDIGAYEYPVTAFITIADLTRALRIASGITVGGAYDISRLDRGYDRRIDVADAVRLARKVFELDPNP